MPTRMAIMAVPTAHTRTRTWVKGAVLLTGLLMASRHGIADDARRIAVGVRIDNATGAALECQALAAHWYSFPVERLEPDRNITMSFSFLPARGEVTAEPASKLPIERLYCGRAGRAWATRGEIDVRAVAARAAADDGNVSLSCRADGAAVSCDETR
jgi:hypothetical protein